MLSPAGTKHTCTHSVQCGVSGPINSVASHANKRKQKCCLKAPVPPQREHSPKRSGLCAPSTLAFRAKLKKKPLGQTGYASARFALDPGRRIDGIGKPQ